MEVSSCGLLLVLLVLPIAYLVLRKLPKDRTKGPPAKARQFTIKGRHFLEWSTDRLLASPGATLVLPSGDVLTANAEVVEHVLKTNFTNYPKGQAANSSLADLLGDGIFNTDGPGWHLQRKLTSLGFHSRSLRSYLTDVFHPAISDRLLPLLSRAVASRRTVDLQSILECFAFDGICRVAFGFDSSLLSPDSFDQDEIVGDSAGFSRAFESAMALILNRHRPHLWRLFRLLGVCGEARLKEEIAIIESFATKVVEDAKKSRPNCLLLPFLDAEGLDEKQLRDVVINFLLAGRDTNSSALTWFFYLISSRPAVREKIRKEISSIRSNRADDKVFGVEELKEMEYLHAAITEAMRLYPPVPLNFRSSAERDELPVGTTVKKGCSVISNLYAMGRMPAMWGEDCLVYRPERWFDSTGEFQTENPCRYPIFYGGPRTCLGKEMAYMQMKALVAAVIEKFEFEVVGEEERGVEVVPVLRMKGGFPVKVRETSVLVDK